MTCNSQIFVKKFSRFFTLERRLNARRYAIFGDSTYTGGTQVVTQPICVFYRKLNHISLHCLAIFDII